MAINLALYPNRIAEDESKFARVVNAKKVKLEKLLRYMSKDTALERTDMLGVMDKLQEAIVFFLSMGNKVDTPFGLFSPRVSNGSMVINGHIPDVDRESMKIGFRPSAEMLRAFQDQCELENQGYAKAQVPELYHLTNMADELNDRQIPAGSLCHLVGKKLSFDKSDPSQGLFFVSAGDPEQETRIEVYSRTGSAYVDFLLSGVAPGNYAVELRSNPGGERPITGRYGSELEVT
jgi:hypothetical protein